MTVVPVEDLVPDVANVRRRDERAQTALAKSMKRFKPARSIVMDGRGVVPAGNGTLEAFIAAGGTEVLKVRPAPGQLVAVVRDDWSPTEATAYGIADNRTTDLATNDETALAVLLKSLESEQFDLGAVGYDDGEVDALLERLGTELVEDAAIKEESWPERTIPESHSIVVRYRDADAAILLRFLDSTDENLLTDGKAGAKILERIRQIAST
jgi:hypothetical protein